MIFLHPGVGDLPPWISLTPTPKMYLQRRNRRSGGGISERMKRLNSQSGLSELPGKTTELDTHIYAQPPLLRKTVWEKLVFIYN